MGEHIYTETRVYVEVNLYWSVRHSHTNFAIVEQTGRSHCNDTTLGLSPVSFPVMNISLFGLKSDRRFKSDRVASKVKV